jgi:hypothetical protein
VNAGLGGLLGFGIPAECDLDLRHGVQVVGVQVGSVLCGDRLQPLDHLPRTLGITGLQFRIGQIVEHRQLALHVTTGYREPLGLLVALAGLLERPRCVQRPAKGHQVSRPRASRRGVFQVLHRADRVLKAGRHITEGVEDPRGQPVAACPQTAVIMFGGPRVDLPEDPRHRCGLALALPHVRLQQARPQAQLRSPAASAARSISAALARTTRRRTRARPQDRKARSRGRRRSDAGASSEPSTASHPLTVHLIGTAAAERRRPGVLLISRPSRRIASFADTIRRDVAS